MNKTYRDGLIRAIDVINDYLAKEKDKMLKYKNDSEKLFKTQNRVFAIEDVLHEVWAEMTKDIKSKEMKNSGYKLPDGY